MIFSLYFIYFMEASFAGWIWECAYNAFTQKKWENRGFLFGPVIPIYGVGVVAVMVITKFLPFSASGGTAWWKIFLGSMAGSAILEYCTSWAMEKIFHAVWWDYSNMPLNLHGRICLPASLLFGAGGVIIARYIVPFAAAHEGNHHPLITEGISLLIMCAFGADLGLSIASIQSVASRVQQLAASVNEQMEKAVEKVSDVREGIEETSAAEAAEIKERLLSTAIGKAISEATPAQRLAFHRIRRTSFSGSMRGIAERYLQRLKRYSPKQLMHHVLAKEEEPGEEKKEGNDEKKNSSKQEDLSKR